MQCHAPICVVGDLVSYFQTAAAAAATPAQQAADFDPFKSFEVSTTERARDARDASLQRQRQLRLRLRLRRHKHCNNLCQCQPASAAVGGDAALNQLRQNMCKPKLDSERERERAHATHCTHSHTLKYARLLHTHRQTNHNTK